MHHNICIEENIANSIAENNLDFLVIRNNENIQKYDTIIFEVYKRESSFYLDVDKLEEHELNNRFATVTFVYSGQELLDNYVIVRFNLSDYKV